MRKKYSLQNHRRIKHSMQAFADRAADDFGITQREVLERTGLRINAENAPRTFDDGSRINENGEFVDANGNVLFQSAMYRNKRTDIKEFTQFVLDNPNNKQSYQIFDKGGVQYTLAANAIKHVKNGHNLSPEDWESVINSFENIVAAYPSYRKTGFGDNNVVLVSELNGQKFGAVITMNGGRNYITTAFKGTEKSLKHWLERNARLLSPDLGNSSSPGLTLDTGSMPSRNQIINLLKTNVKAIPDENTDSARKVYHQDGKLDIRGYFDWSNKMQQILVTTRLLIPI